MKLKNTKVATFAVTIITLGSITGEANAALTVNITETNSASFSWNITGDFSGLPTPTENLNTINILFYDTNGVLMTTINPSLQGFNTGQQASGAVNGSTFSSNAWGFIQTGGDEYLAPTTGNSVDRWYFSTPLGNFSGTDVVTTPISSSGSGAYTGLNWTDFSEAVAVWGNNPVPAPGSIPEPSSALLLGLGALGLIARRKRTA